MDDNLLMRRSSVEHIVLDQTISNLLCYAKSFIWELDMNTQGKFNFSVQKITLLTILCIFYTLSNTLAFGDPYISDDPVPEDYHCLDTTIAEIINRYPSNVFYQTPSIEWEYGIIKDRMEVNLTLVYVANHAFHSDKTTRGISDPQIGTIYRFIQETKYIPQVAFEPAITIPTASSKRGLGYGKVTEQFPLSAQKTWGKWTSYGDINYYHIPTKGIKNYFAGGAVLQRQTTEKLSLGAEIYEQGAVTAKNSATTFLNVGLTYYITNHLIGMAGVGHNIAGSHNEYAFFGVDYSTEKPPFTDKSTTKVPSVSNPFFNAMTT